MRVLSAFRPERHTEGQDLPANLSFTQPLPRQRAAAEWPSEKQRVKRLCQEIGADLISVAGHSM